MTDADRAPGVANRSANLDSPQASRANPRMPPPRSEGKAMVQQRIPAGSPPVWIEWIAFLAGSTLLAFHRPRQFPGPGSRFL